MSCYNSSEYVESAIKSILSQTFQDFEFIIINDGSTDTTLHIISRYAKTDSRVSVIDKSNTGLTDSLNIGIKTATGKWIARIDSDDCCLPDRFELQLAFLNCHPEVTLLGTAYTDMNKNGCFEKKHFLPSSHKVLYWHLKRMKKMFPHSSVLFNKQKAQEIGGYRVRYKAAQDWDLWLRFAESGRISCLNLPLVGIRRLTTSISNHDRGEKQRLFGFAATVSHFLRLSSYPDPCENSEMDWEYFLFWLKYKLASDKITYRLEQCNYLKSIMTRQTNQQKTSLSNISTPGCLAKLIFDKFFGSYLPQKYALEWQKLNRQISAEKPINKCVHEQNSS
jgi:glycosyltransferase involved in cell wall biosynthesis